MKNAGIFNPFRKHADFSMPTRSGKDKDFLLRQKNRLLKNAALVSLVFMTIQLNAQVAVLKPKTDTSSHHFKEVSKAVASDRGTEHLFGSAVAVFGDYALIGAPQHGNSQNISEIPIKTLSGMRTGKHGNNNQDGSFKKSATSHPHISTGSISGASGESKNSLSTGSNPGFLAENSSPISTSALNDAGAAYIFKRNAQGEWEEHQMLVASDQEQGDKFGVSVDMHGDLAIIGAYFKDAEQGAAYVFMRDDQDNWVEIKKIMASDAQDGARFGIDVAIQAGTEDTTAVVGAYYQNAPLNNSGMAYVFSKNGTTWTEQKIKPESSLTGDSYGISVDIHKKNIVVGAWLEGINDAGAVYVFSKDGDGIWYEAQKLISDLPRNTRDEFGYSVAIHENYLAVGERKQNQVYIFKENRTGSWKLSTKVTGNDTEYGNPAFVWDNHGDLFGVDVELSGEFLVVGAREDGPASMSSHGSVYIFKNDGKDVWEQFEKITASDSAAGDKFGSKVAIHHSTVLAGSLYEDEDETGNNVLQDAGAVYVFERTAPVMVQQIHDQTFYQGFGSTTIDLSQVFYDINDDPLSYNVSGSNDDAIIPAISGNVLTLTEAGKGGAVIALIASDGNGGELKHEFTAKIIRKEPLAYFPFDGNAADQQSFLTDTAVDINYESGTAASFNGTSSYIGAGTNFQAVGPFSFSLWVKRNTDPFKRDVENLITKLSDGNCNENNRQFSLALKNNGVVRFSFNGSTGYGSVHVLEGETNIVDNQWHHIYVSYDSVGSSPSERVEMYIDNQEEGLSVFLSHGNDYEIEAGNAHLAFGYTLNSSGRVCGTKQRYYSGLMDEVAIYDRLLLTAELDSLSRSRTATPETKELIAYYPFNGNAMDSITGTAGQVNSASLTSDRFGRSNAAYEFDGADDYINLGDSGTFRFGKRDFSISLWFYTDGQPQFSHILAKRDTANNYRQYNIYFAHDYQFGGSSTKLNSFIRYDGSGDRIVQTAPLTEGWHHAVMVQKYDSQLELYVNGHLAGVDSTSSLDKTVNIDGIPLVLGSQSHKGRTSFYEGKIDDLGIYNYALSKTEIADLYDDYSQDMDTTTITSIHHASMNKDPMTGGSGKNLLIYPNPVENTLNIKAAPGSSVQIINQTGRLVYTGRLYRAARDINHTALDVSALQNGMYIITIRHNGHVFVNRFLKR